jgi:ABC-2 type transport system permease protein
MAVLTIARLTIRETARRRLLWALVGLTLATMLLTAWAFQRVAEVSPVEGTQFELGLSQLLVALAFMFSFVLAMTAVFAGGPAIGSEVESGLVLAMLARPIRRADLVIGRWLGLGTVLVVYAFGAGAGELAVINLVTGYWPADPLIAAMFLAGEGLVVLTFALLLSTRVSAITTGAIAVVLFGVAWMAGILGGVGSILGNDTLAAVGPVSRLVLPTDVLWRGTMFGLEPPASVISAAGPARIVFEVSPFYAADPPPLEWVAWAVLWVVIVLGLAVWSFNRREL